MTPVVTRNLLARVESDYAFPALPEYSAHRHIRSCFVGCPPSRLRNRPRFASGRAQETERRQGELSVCPARSLHRETGLIQNSPAPPVAPGSSQGPKEPRSVSMQGMTRAPPPAMSRAVGPNGSGHLRCSEPCEHTCQAGSQMSKVCVSGGQAPLRTLVRVSDLQIFTIIDGITRLEPPHGRAPPELNPTLNRRLGAMRPAVHLCRRAGTRRTGSDVRVSPAGLPSWRSRSVKASMMSGASNARF